MSKIEIVKSLNDCGPQLEILRTLRELQSQGQSLSQELAPLAHTLREQADRMQEQTSALAEDMKSLPQALASEVAPMLAELERLASMLDTNMEAQRSTFSVIASTSAEQWKAQLQEAQTLNQALQERLAAMEGKEELTVKAARAMINVPAKIEKTVEDHAKAMTDAMDEWKRHERSKKPWRLVLATADRKSVV
jgi:DNA repair exonuclease SbcCD ATPase subunit